MADPSASTVDRLIDMWQTVLHTDDIVSDDDFFELGGNSIIAVRMLPLIKEAFGVEPDMTVVFDHPTPRELASALEDLQRA